MKIPSRIESGRVPGKNNTIVSCANGYKFDPQTGEIHLEQGVLFTLARS